jgi:hypothetical protein
MAYSIAYIWAATAVTSVFAPDMVTGSDHEHFPLAAVVGWLFALVATGLVATALTRRHRRSVSLWVGVTASNAAIWTGVAVASVFGPTLVTGTDPTVIPLVALVAPVVGTLATAFVCVFAAGGESD